MSAAQAAESMSDPELVKAWAPCADEIRQLAD